MTSSRVPIGEHTPTADERIVLNGRSWADFEQLLAIRGDAPAPRMAYLDGMVELMSPSDGHEETKSMLAVLVEQYCLERDITFWAIGSWLLKRKPKNAGLEPDECYVFGDKPRNKAREQGRPDLAIEVTWTSGGIDKLEIYARLGVAEVWFWERDAIAVFVLAEAGYQRRKRSVCLPALDLALICRVANLESVNEAVRKLRASLR